MTRLSTSGALRIGNERGCRGLLAFKCSPPWRTSLQESRFVEHDAALKTTARLIADVCVGPDRYRLLRAMLLELCFRMVLPSYYH